MCQLFETIRIDAGRIDFLHYHQQRVDRSIGNTSISLLDYVKHLPLPVIGCHKLRITYTPDEILGHTISSYSMRNIKTLRLVFDDHIDYHCKWEDRNAIEHLYALREDCDDIVIVRNGLVTDTSFANIALFDGEKWITPSKPLLQGTCRARLIENKIIIPKPVPIESFVHYKKIILINAMLGFNESRSINIPE